jgi:hypothetical protein
MPQGGTQVHENDLRPGDRCFEVGIRIAVSFDPNADPEVFQLLLLFSKQSPRRTSGVRIENITLPCDLSLLFALSATKQ